jgi:aspartyl aminopeptidase
VDRCFAIDTDINANSNVNIDIKIDTNPNANLNPGVVTNIDTNTNIDSNVDIHAAAYTHHANPQSSDCQRRINFYGHREAKCPCTLQRCSDQSG